MKVTFNTDTKAIESEYIKRLKALNEVVDVATLRLEKLVSGEVESTWGPHREVSYLTKLVDRMWGED
jgi:hypothetical protein